MQPAREGAAGRVKGRMEGSVACTVGELAPCAPKRAPVVRDVRLTHSR